MAKKGQVFESVSARRLYESLDGRVVRSSEAMWRIKIYSVVTNDDGYWIQLALGGASALNVLLRVDSLADPTDVLGALESRLSHRESADGAFVDVRRLGAWPIVQGSDSHVPADSLLTAAP